MLKPEGSKICKSVPEHNFAQGLDFSCCERNTPINTVDVINVNKMKNKGLFIEAFFSIFVWVLQLAVVIKLLFIADFFDSQNKDQFALDCCDSRTQVHEITSRDRDGKSDRDCWSYNDGLDSWGVIAWSGDGFGLGWCSTNSCNGMRLVMLELL